MNYSYYIALFVILVLVMIVIFVAWIKVNKTTKEKGILMKKFEDFSIQNNLAIDKKQVVGKNMIGIDRLNFKLVFLDTRPSKWKFHLIDMENILSCNLIKERNKTTGHIGKISLHCRFENEAISDIKFAFYDESKDDEFKTMRSFKKAFYWKKCIDIFSETAKLSVKKNKKIAV